MRGWAAIVAMLAACTGDIDQPLDRDGGAAADADPNAPDADPNAPDAGTSAPDADPNDVAQMCARWSADRVDLSEGTWTGDVATCTAGDITDPARPNTVRLVNLYRWLAGLPAVTNDPTRDAAAQECALMQRANGMLSHTPPMSWDCYTALGAEAAGRSNISSGQSVRSIDAYMADIYAPTTLGHRRWILSNSLGPIGIGGTDAHSCLYVIGGSGSAGAPWTAWPAPGPFPIEAMTAGSGGVDAGGWSVQSDSINLNGASVTVTAGGQSLPVTVSVMGANYGSASAIRILPEGWTSQAGTTYHVELSGILTPISYDVSMVDCP